MPVRDVVLRPRHLIHRTALLAGTSALALSLAMPVAQARPIGASASYAATTNATDAASAASQQAQAIARQAQSAMTKAVQSLQAVQSAARAAAQAAGGSVPNGLAPGGLVVDPRVTAGTDANLWVNANLPTQSSSNGQTTVTIKQNSQRAIMTWQQFNVGASTIVNFDQSGGNSTNGNNWVALNRIDATGSPSQIQGSIKADGTVLIINPNGIIFAGSSQINVHTLIASTLDINSYKSANVGVFGTDTTIGGIYVPVTVNGAAVVAPNGTPVLAPPQEDSANAAFLQQGLYINGSSLIVAAGIIPNQLSQGILVQSGASISTNVSGFDNGGYVALLGQSVINHGSISTSAGQIIMAAGSQLWLTQPANGNNLAATALNPSQNSVAYAPAAIAGGAVVTNDGDGLLSSDRGNITLAGDLVNQFGVAQASTSITRPGSITVAAAQLLTFGADSVTTILPDENGEAMPQSSGSTFVPPSIAINATNLDMQGSAGGHAGALILAPGATMTVATASLFVPGTAQLPTGRVLLESGSVIDLSGLDATASVTNYLYTFKVTANDVADSPLAQNLIGRTVTIDLRLSGTRADGLAWVGSPLFSATGAGYLGDLPQNIDQRLTQGGSLSFTGTNAGYEPFNDVLQQAGSVVNVSGGQLNFTGGFINTTRLLGQDGRIYSIGSANPFNAYLGIAGEFTVNHTHWNVTDSWTNALMGGGYYQPGYTDGISAGSLSVIAGNPVLEGSLLGSTMVGDQQTALAQAATGANGMQASPDQLPSGAGLSLGLVAAAGFVFSDTVVLQNGVAGLLGPGFGMKSQLNLPTTSVVSGLGGQTTKLPELSIAADNLSAGDFSSISISGTTALSMAQGASLSVRPGGSIKLAGVTTIDGTLTAHSGSISLTGYTGGNSLFNAPPTSQVTIGPDAVLDASGLWVDDAGTNGTTALGSAYINGGSVTIQTNAESSAAGTFNGPGSPVFDVTQSIVLSSGSLIDVSSGGYIQRSGKFKTAASGLPAGTGGNLSLLTYVSGSGNQSVSWQDPNNNFQGQPPGNVAPTGTNRPNQANIFLDGTIDSAGLAQGGTFALRVPMVQIGGVATPTSFTTGAVAGELALPASFFSSNGFSSYALTSTYGSINVVASTNILLQQENYLLPAKVGAPVSGLLRDFATVGLARAGFRQPVNLTLTQLPYGFGGANDVSTNAGILLDNGAAITAEPQATVALTAAGPVTVLGSIVAHGGSIKLTNDGSPLAGNAALGTQAPLDVWVGPHAVLDVSGVFVADPLVTTYATGTVLDGGSIALSGGTIVAMPGAYFDLAGTSATVQLLGPSGLAGIHTIAQPLWSNGGALILAESSAVASGTPGELRSAYFAGTVNAAGGAPRASGGVLTIGELVGGVDGYGAIVVTPSGNVTDAFNASALSGGAYPTTTAQLAALLPTGSSIAFVTADTLNRSGFDSISLMATTIAFSGNVSVKVPDALVLSGNIALLAAGSTNPAATAPSIGATIVNLNAGYVLLAGSGSSNSIAVPSLSDGTLNVNASAQIDVAGFVTISNTANANLTSAGDIRLLSERDPMFTTGVYAGGYFSDLIALISQVPQNAIQFPGALLVSDNLRLTAREVYPATDSAFLLMSTGQASGPGTMNTITIASNGRTPVVPLSANGEILIDAPTIVQAGALLAPLGTIQLGVNDGQALPPVWSAITNGAYALPAAVSTRSLTLNAGSVTSVTAIGVDVPYGVTVDGGSWNEYDRLLPDGTSPSNLAAPPAKLIVLDGAAVNTQPGALLDLRGGGDVYATEFVTGTGGSSNVLTTVGKGQSVYALVPSYEAPIAQSDLIYGTTVAPGTSVTLPGGNGVAAGTYTLMPAIYATLPGAYRVVVVSTSTNPLARPIVSADGSIYTTGILGNAISGSRSSQTAWLEIQPNTTWTRYSEIDITSGNTYFANLAAVGGTVTPPLPIDAGQLVIGATTSLSLQATNAFAPAPGGRGGLADIAGTNLLVLAPDQAEPAAYVADGYIVLNSDQISNLGAESVLIGGTRTQQGDGTWVTPTAASVVVATDAAHPLSAPDLLLIANPSASSTDYNYIDVDGYEAVAIPLVAAGTGKVTVLPGSVIEAKGTASLGAPTVLHMGTSSSLAATQSNLNQFDSYTKYAPDGNYLLDNNNPITAFYAQAYSGGGLAAVLEVSNGLAASIQRVLPSIPATVTVTNGNTFVPPALPSVAGIDVGAGAVLAGGNALMLNASNLTLANTARISANNIGLAAGAINFGNVPANAAGLTLSPAIIAQLAGVQSVTLTSASVFNSYDTAGVSFGDPTHPIGTLTLDGAAIYSAGGTTTIAAGNVVLTDSQTTPNNNGGIAGTGGRLIINAVGAAGSITIGAGATTLAGFGQIALDASQQIAFTGSGSLDAGAATVVLTAPAVVAHAAAAQSLATSGLLTIAAGAGTGPTLDPIDVGGAVTLTGSSIADSGTIIALGGQVTLIAKTGDVALNPGAHIVATGSHIMLFDEALDAPGGTVQLTASAGNVSIASGASVDVSATGNGFAGSLTIQTATTGTATLDGTLSGGAAYKDLGGNFTLNAGKLAAGSQLPTSFTGSIAVTLQQGDIVIGTDADALAPSLSAGQITLAAIGGSVVISGSGDPTNPNDQLTIIDASGRDGQIALFGANGVMVNSGVRMTAAYVADSPSDPNYANGASTLTQNGGIITLGTSGTPDGTTNARYGYENVDTSGAITVASNVAFDVSGGQGGPNISNTGGAVVLRAPILTNGNVNVSFNGTVVTDSNGNPSGPGIVLDVYAVWSTTDNNGTAGATHFDGIIDPAGWYNANGSQIPGTTTNGDIFTPTGAVNQNHVDFYQNTLVDFVNNAINASAIAGDFADSSGLASTLHFRPEIDLVSPASGTGSNGGNITVASNWNLGAGSFSGPGGAYVPTYRTLGGRDPGEPGVLSLVAANNVQINATVSDGFYETSNPLFAPIYPTGITPFSYANVSANYQSLLNLLGSFGLTLTSMPGLSSITAPPVVGTFSASWNSADQTIWYGAITNVYLESALQTLFLHLPNRSFMSVGASHAVFDNNPNDYNSYADYLSAYNSNYVGANFASNEPASLTAFNNDPTTYPSYQAYTNAYLAYARSMTVFMQQYFQANPTQANNFPSPMLAPVPPPTFGTSYETSASTYFGDYAFYTGNNYFNYVMDVVDPRQSTGAGAFLRALPYLPAINDALNPLINLTAPAAVAANQIANNPARTGSFVDYNTTTAASLMPASVSGQGSFSYRVVAGAQFTPGGNLTADPEAVITVPQGTVTTGANPSDSVTLNGHTSYTNPNTNPSTGRQFQIDVPTVLRTGTGSITIDAAGSFELLDTTAPGAVYTAGVAAPVVDGFTAPTIPPFTAATPFTQASYVPTGLVTNPAWGIGGGAVTIVAGNSIVGIEMPVDADGSQSGTRGLPTGELWSAWYYVDGSTTGAAAAPFNPGAGGIQNSAWVNYGTFFQGIGALGGGNVRLKAGADIDDISASLPETIQVSGGQSAFGQPATAHYFGGGDLLVQAGGNLYSSAFYVGRGTAQIQAGGTVAADPNNPVTNTPTVLTTITYLGGKATLGPTTPLPLLLAVQDGFVTVSAARLITLGDTFDPTHIPFDTAKLDASLGTMRTAMPAGLGAAFDTYGAVSGVALTSAAGDVTLNTLMPSSGSVGLTDSLFVKLAFGGTVVSNGSIILATGGDVDNGIQPATLDVTALGGNIFLGNSVTIFQSPIGNINLTAAQSISTEAFDDTGQPVLTQLSMADGAAASLLGSTSTTLKSALHAADPVPAVIYAGSDITGSFSLIKPALIEAGRDIIDTSLVGQNNNSTDITSVIAGRDIIARQLLGTDGHEYDNATTFVIYGPGTLLIEAGRNLGPFFTGSANAGGNSSLSLNNHSIVSGIETIGDGSNLGTLSVKPYLPVQGANVYALFGVGAGVDYQAAMAAYVDPAEAGTGGINFLADIAAKLQQTPADAWKTFRSLSTAQQHLLIDRAFLDFIAQVGIDYNNPASAYFHQYARAYDAIATLFPASLGYTDNAAAGVNGSAVTRATGDLNMAHSLLQTQSGGDIALIGPGGNIFVGANAKDDTPVNQEGILTLQGGSILTYTDQSVIVDQSRIFTEQGGNIDLFSANGNLNAGKGPKSAASFPPLSLIWDPDGYSRVNPAGLVTGAGIGALLSVPGQDPSLSNVDLVAPHGTVDAGAAGIRVSGNLNIAALQVLNAFNIQVNGVTIGIPTTATPPVGALAASNNTAGAAAKTAEAPHQPGSGDQASIIIVEFLGFGGGNEDGSPTQSPQQDKKDDVHRSQIDGDYDPYSPVHLLGHGELTERQKKKLSQDEVDNLEKVIGQTSSR